jgi:hypothetical protein
LLCSCSSSLLLTSVVPTLSPCCSLLLCIPCPPRCSNSGTWVASGWQGPRALQLLRPQVRP